MNPLNPEYFISVLTAKRNEAKTEKLKCDPINDSFNFRYYQGRQEAFEDAIELLTEHQQ